MIRARIISTGSYVPENVITNNDLEQIVDTSDEWILERTGIRERRIVDGNQVTSDLAYEAAHKALKKADVKARDIDLIIVATISGDMVFPSTACILQHKLGAKKAAAFDLNAACSGFVYGLHVANSLIKSGAHNRILLVGAEVISKFTDWSDRTTCVLFGDGAGAVLLEGTKEKRGIYSTHIYSDGSLSDLISLPGGGSKYPCSKETILKRLHFMKMKGNETFKVAVRTLEQLATRYSRGKQSGAVTAFAPYTAPGQSQDHSCDREKTWVAGREGVHQYRKIWQYLCCVNTDSP